MREPMRGLGRKGIDDGGRHGSVAQAAPPSNGSVPSAVTFPPMGFPSLTVILGLADALYYSTHTAAQLQLQTAAAAAIV